MEIYLWLGRDSKRRALTASGAVLAKLSDVKKLTEKDCFENRQECREFIQKMARVDKQYADFVPVPVKVKSGDDERSQSQFQKGISKIIKAFTTSAK